MIFCLLALATTASHANAERDHAISSPVTDSEPQCPFTIQEVSLLQHAVRISQTALPFEILQVQPSSAPQYPRQPAKNVTSVVNGTWIAELLRMFRPLYYNEPERSQVHKRVVHTWWSDLIPDSYHTILPDGDEGLSFFTSAPHTEWFILAGTCVALSLIDFLLLQRLPSTFGVHCAVLAFWICAALAYGIALRCRTNHSAATEWFSGYMLEWILSMDNLFVFHLVLDAFRTPAKQVHKAVFVGIIGAVLIRMVFFMVVSTLLRVFHWIRFPFGLLLLWSGVEAAKGGDDDVNVEDTRLVRSLKWVLGSRLHEGYDEHGIRAFMRGADGKRQATLLFLVIASLECTDVLFALDSVSAKVAQIPNQYLAFSSSVLAMYGLRAMFFIVKDLVAMFELLQYGLCLILVFIGVELMLADYINMSSSTVCVLIASVFAVCISGSMALRCTRKHDKDLADVPDNEIVNNGSAAQALEGGRMDARIPG
mmetsp:Transcript_91047/g.175267  ORF Transcript_91047/g.175267 Transcript_91047/m.175267 type:complete len:481 (+) Transcript_91047:54-1496(+)